MFYVVSVREFWRRVSARRQNSTTNRNGAKMTNSTASHFKILSGGSLEGISDSPAQPSSNLSAENGQNNSTPPPTLVVRKSSTPCEAKASPQASTSLRC